MGLCVTGYLCGDVCVGCMSVLCEGVCAWASVWNVQVRMYVCVCVGVYLCDCVYLGLCLCEELFLWVANCV